MTRTGRRTVPQVFIGETHVGGYDDLSALDRKGGLTPLLESPDAIARAAVKRPSAARAARSRNYLAAKARAPTIDIPSRESPCPTTTTSRSSTSSAFT